MIAQPEAYSAYIKHQLGFYFKACKVAQWVWKLVTQAQHPECSSGDPHGRRREQVAPGCLLTPLLTLMSMHMYKHLKINKRNK